MNYEKYDKLNNYFAYFLTQPSLVKPGVFSHKLSLKRNK
jgi:hypothetical protein